MSPGHNEKDKLETHHSRAPSNLRNNFVETGSMSLKKSMRVNHAIDKGPMQSEMDINKMLVDHKTVSSRAQSID